MLVFQETIKNDRPMARITSLSRNAFQVHRNSRPRLWHVRCGDVTTSGQDVLLHLRSLLPETRPARSV